jgi:hypothetical protein
MKNSHIGYDFRPFHKNRIIFRQWFVAGFSILILTFAMYPVDLLAEVPIQYHVVGDNVTLSGKLQLKSGRDDRGVKGDMRMNAFVLHLTQPLRLGVKFGSNEVKEVTITKSVQLSTLLWVKCGTKNVCFLGTNTKVAMFLKGKKVEINGTLDFAGDSIASGIAVMSDVSVEDCSTKDNFASKICQREK